MQKGENQLQAARKVYETYWDSYIRGDAEAFATTLDDTFEMIGTSETEICHSKADGIRFLKAQIQEVVGKVEMRTRQINVAPVDALMLVNEQCDIYVLIDQNWNFYSKLRISTLLRETKEGWKVVQQHGSMPDIRLQEGETMAIEKIGKENLELRDAVKRKTAELENKNRELEIEAALEKVRAAAMSMKRPDDMLDVCLIISDQLQQFGVEHIRNVQTAIIDEHIGQYLCYQYFTPYDKTAIENTEYFKSPVEHEMVRQMLASRDGHFIGSLSRKGLDEFRKHRKEENHFPDPLLDDASEISYCFLSIGEGGLGLSLYQAMDNDVLNLFKRFHQVFSLAYQRFRDIQKAEAQAREAKIEAALEKVRSRSLAMHSTSELGEVVTVIVEKLTELAVVRDTNGVVLCTYFQNSKDVLHWIVSPDFSMAGSYLLPYFDHPIFNDASQSKESSEEYFSKAYSVENKNSFFEYAFEHSDYRHFPVEFKQWVFQNDKHILSFAWQKNSAILILSYTGVVPSADEVVILKRFAKVFEQSYIRFLDLQKTEAQAREAQIEAALERIRSRAMTMHSSDELNDVVHKLFTEFQQLDLPAIATDIIIFNEDGNTANIWISGSDGTEGPYLTRALDHPHQSGTIEAWKNNLPLRVTELKDEYFKDFFELAFYKTKGIKTISEETKKWVLGLGRIFHSEAFTRHGCIRIASLEKLTDISEDTLQRFAKVFEQTYTRFLDLQKAETQAREAKIEAALERVRSKAMGMHNSEDLNATIGAFYRELEQFSITPRRCGVGLLQKNRIAELSTMNTMEHGNSIEIIGILKMEGHWVLDGVYDNWCLQKEFHPVLRGNEIKEYNQLLRPQVAFPEYPNDSVQFGYFFFFPEGGVYAWTLKEMKEDELKIYRRFTTVLSLTYKRYKDLNIAESNALEAVRRASLDRVRAEIASMRTVSDLQRITPIIWHELIALNVPFFRCGVFIMNEITEHVQVYLSSPDGNSLAALDLSFYSSELSINAVNHWRQGIIFKTHWNRQEFISWMKSMIALGQVNNQETYQGAAQPPESLHLHFVPFKQGMLYVGNTSPLEKEALELVKALAESFSIAFARYEDFKQLEMAKNQIEKTLTELKSTQAQLVQAEKMASLGELTAGIAHEIQNPLNFVNNFSEISNELIDEMNEELDKGDFEEARTISNDIKQNLHKINHHGKRADAIVKGMLQHSRKSNGEKEPTDMNALADEYLRLAYHGLRAKDKSFNAEFKTDFDPALPKVNVIPQEMGRVLLNLINNAFYAVQLETQNSSSLQQKPQKQQDYNPTVMVTTKNMGNHVEIRIKDNGPGIPAEIKDKIFQPFFTTKPTGQGTGLGLSLSYDIVKAHGGELRVETKEARPDYTVGRGDGTSFIVEIPVY